MKRVLLIDASNLLFRGYHAITSRMKSSVVNDDGTDNENGGIPLATFAVSFLQSFRNYVVKFEAEEIYTAWDKKLLHPSTNFRKQSTDVAYKATRDPEVSKKVFATEAILSPVLASLGIKNMYPRVMEADDVIAWLAHKHKDDKVTIVSVDKDLAQLVTANCSFYDPIQDNLITPDNFEAHLNVPIDKFILYKAIVGDVSDNINGLDGYGKKRGRDLALDWDNSKLEKEQYDAVASYVKLIDLAHGYTVHPEEVVSYQEQLDQHSNTATNFKEFALLVETHKLTQIKYQMEKWRGVFNRSGKIGTTPINNYLKNLFA